MYHSCTRSKLSRGQQGSGSAVTAPAVSRVMGGAKERNKNSKTGRWNYIWKTPKRLMSQSPKLQVMFASAFSWIAHFWDSYFLSYGEFVEFIMKLSRAALRPVLAVHERGALPLVGGAWGVTARKASHNASNARGVTAGKMRSNSSNRNVHTSEANNWINELNVQPVLSVFYETKL